MSFVNTVFKATVAAGIVVGSAVAYARLSDEQKELIKGQTMRLRRKVADFISPNDGVYTIPREVEEELSALLNND